MSLPQRINMVDLAAQVVGMGRYARQTSDLTARVSSVPRTPLDAAAETLKACLPSQHRPWATWRAQAWAIVKDGREDRTALERLVIRRYKDALAEFKATGEVTR